MLTSMIFFFDDEAEVYFVHCMTNYFTIKAVIL